MSHTLLNQVLERCSSNYKLYLETHFKLRMLRTPNNMWINNVFLIGDLLSSILFKCNGISLLTKSDIDQY